jgi:hypothetical protein
MYYPFMDYYITELTARLLENGGRYQAQYLIPMNLPRLPPDTVDDDLSVVAVLAGMV